MIIFLSVLSAIVFIAICYFVGNYMLDTFYSEIIVQFLSTILGFMMVCGLVLGVSLVAYLFYELWSNLL